MVHYTSVLRACLLGSCAASIVPSDTNMDRRSVQVSTDKTLYCGVFGSGAKDTMATLEHDLVSGKHKKRVWTIGPGECNRVHCYQTTGIYVCNASVCIVPFFLPIFAPSLFPPLSPGPPTWPRNGGKRSQKG